MIGRRSATTARKGKTAPPTTIDRRDVIIGRDLLELVSSAMYVDPMTIYREYVQNAADAVDDGRQQGLIAPNEAGRVDITIDPASRTVRIRDNGTGIPAADFVRRVTALGSSQKRATKARGFRGVGRLSGLGYAQELIFRSRAAGEGVISELRWDCRRLKALLRDIDERDDLAALVASIVLVDHRPADDAPPHFFEVELNGVIRLRSDRLMSSAAVADYLGQVAPVPFSPNFHFGAQITAALKERVDLGELVITVSGQAEPVYRPHRDTFGDKSRHVSRFDAVSFVDLPAIDGEPAAVAWVLHHDYDGAVPNSALVKGLRLRSGNMQVGDHALLEELFAEPRFNAWSVGEIHVLDPKIIPNGRRDNFEQNAHWNNLINQLSPVARDISRRCRTSSAQRKWLRDFELQGETVAASLAIIEQNGVGRDRLQRHALDVEKGLIAMEKIAGMDLLAKADIDAGTRVSEFRTRLSVLMNEDGASSSPLARLPAKSRKMYENFFELVYECSVNRVAAKALVDRILQRI